MQAIWLFPFSLFKMRTFDKNFTITERVSVISIDKVVE
jgi:hypothetical protein